MKILVTGANGYLGSGIVKELIKKGYKVIATDFGDCYIDNRCEIKKCDLFSIDDPYNYFGCPDVLLHMAWKDGFVHNSNSHIENLDKHFSFLEKMSKSNIKRIAVMGTMHEIGFFEGSINENTPANPESLYGIAKNALREMTRLLCKQHNKEFQWLRAFYIVGNSINGSSIFSKIALAESKGEKKFPFTMGTNQWDFIDYDDFCEQVVAAVGQNKINGIINICSGYPQKLSDRVERYIRDNNYQISLDYGKFPDRPYDSKAVWGDDKRIKQIISNNN